MKLVKTLLPLLLAATFTSAIPVSGIPRSVTTVPSDIGSISTEFNNITSAVASLTEYAVAYTGGVLQTAALVIILQSLESTITATAYDIASSGPFNSTDSKVLLLAIVSLIPKIVTFLDDLDAVASTIASVGYTSTFASLLSTLTKYTDSLFTAIKQNLDPADSASIAPLQALIDAAFATANATF